MLILVYRYIFFYLKQPRCVCFNTSWLPKFCVSKKTHLCCMSVKRGQISLKPKFKSYFKEWLSQDAKMVEPKMKPNLISY